MSSEYSIVSFDKNFHAGMTLEQAEKQYNYDENKLKNFSKIDKNNDGVLSADEVILSRKEDVKRCKSGSIVGFIGAIVGGVFIAAGIKEYKSFKKFVLGNDFLYLPFSNLYATLLSVISPIGSVLMYKVAKTEAKKTQQMEQELLRNSEKTIKDNSLKAD